MTTFFLKIIAASAMLLDHTGTLFEAHSHFFQDTFNISFEAMRGIIEIFHGIGRLSFPVFAFLLTIGYQRTSSKKNYLSNLLTFAILSQIPYCLLFSNYDNFKENSKYAFFCDPSDFYIKALYCSVLFAVACIFCYRKFAKPFKDKTLKVLTAALLLTTISSLKFNYITFIGGTNNIFYTLAFGIYICYCYDYFIPVKKLPISDYILLVPLCIFSFSIKMDYEIFGVILILALYSAKKFRLIQAAIILLWGFLIYNGFNISLWAAFGLLLASILVAFYNGEKGYNVKWLFYLFYPSHLLVLGVLNILLLFST